MTPACRAVEQCSTGPGCTHGRGCSSTEAFFCFPSERCCPELPGSILPGGTTTAAMIFGDAEHGEAGRIRVGVTASSIFGPLPAPAKVSALVPFGTCLGRCGSRAQAFTHSLCAPGAGRQLPTHRALRVGLASPELCATRQGLCVLQSDTQDPLAASQCSGCAPTPQCVSSQPSPAHEQG